MLTGPRRPATVSSVSDDQEEGCGTSRWVDPRRSPKPPARPKAPAEDPSEIEPLVRLCQRGKLYAVERWIAEGRPIQAAKHYVKGRRQFDSPLAIAMESKQREAQEKVSERPSASAASASEGVGSPLRRNGIEPTYGPITPLMCLSLP